MAEIHTPASALIKALEASIALRQDPVTGTPDWSIGINEFWMRLADLGFEITERPDGLVPQVASNLSDLEKETP